MPSVLSKPITLELEYPFRATPTNTISTPVSTYYNDFSKYLNTLNTSATDSNEITYKDWIKSKGAILRTVKLCDLKQTMRTCKLRISGNKSELIERIDKHFKRIQSAISIQRVFRGFLVREMEKMHGPISLVRNETDCVNDSDFHTMAPLSSIPHETFFSYRSADGFIYGFSIFSLILLFKCTKRFENPYTREVISAIQICNLTNLYRKLYLVCPHLCNLDDSSHQFAMYMTEMIPKSSLRSRNEEDDIREDYVFLIPDPAPPSAEEVRNEDALRIVRDITFYLSTDERIESLFHKMSELIGSEIKAEWFRKFRRNDYERFYNFYYVWWSRLNGLRGEERQNVCGITDPFINFQSVCQSNIADEYYKLICLDLMEWMVYTGIDQEHQKKGAMQTLTVLTIVSREARNEWPNLFENEMS